MKFFQKLFTDSLTMYRVMKEMDDADNKTNLKDFFVILVANFKNREK
ncbi:hypothetical protein M3612_16485 [Niallia taxi]|nr:hypothetical protein [Niallia taxi]MCM3216097.1 hypothetical protein [Niallia taxi]